MGIKLDKVNFSSFHPGFANRDKQTASLVLSGTIPNGGQNFSTSVPTPREHVVSEVYYRKTGSNPRRRADNGLVMLDVVWDHNVYIQVGYTATEITINVFVDNPSGGPKSMTSQTVNFAVYIFDSPFSN